MIDIVFDSSKDQVAYFNKALKRNDQNAPSKPSSGRLLICANLFPRRARYRKVRLSRILKAASNDSAGKTGKHMRRARFGVNQMEAVFRREIFSADLPHGRIWEVSVFREKMGLWFRR